MASETRQDEQGKALAPVSVVGAGSWGTALALVLARKGYPVTLWAREGEAAEQMNRTRENARYLPGIRFPDTLQATADLGEAVRDKRMVVSVTPSHTVRDVMGRAAFAMSPDTIVVSASKGIEQGSLKIMSEVLAFVLPPALHRRIAVLSGPSFAKEVAQGQPTAVVVAAGDEAVAKTVQDAFHTDYFRCYTSRDVIGAELGGALKNVIALAAGIAEGLGFGHNTKAALITRGVAEISRLAEHRGADPLTLAGLAGMGDLVLTCTGELSRNRQVGVALGKGETLEQILGRMTQVAEGVKTTKSARELSRREGVDMPIVEQVFQILYEGRPAKQAVVELLRREAKPERLPARGPSA